MLFSLKLQRDNRQNALSVAPVKGKTGGKGCIFTALWDETTAYYDRAFLNHKYYLAVLWKTVDAFFFEAPKG